MAVASASSGKQQRAAGKKGVILYADHAGHLSPLTITYYATASRHLTSGRRDVVPPSTTTEVESAYCPRCLTFCEAASARSGTGSLVRRKGATSGAAAASSSAAMGGGYCSRTHCKMCPVCFSPVSISIDPVDGGVDRLVCHFACGFCSWSSRECGVISDAGGLLSLQSSGGGKGGADAEEMRKLIVAGAPDALASALEKRIEEISGPGEDAFYGLIGTWSKREQEDERRRRLKGLRVAGDESKSHAGGNGPDVWSVESLEESLSIRKKEMAFSWQGADPAYIVNEVQPQIDGKDRTSDDLVTAEQVAAQSIITTAVPRFRSDLLPVPVPLRARESRRCLAELAAGKTGILVKPKLNPLEGDTSLRAGHGQWWKKDSSAIHVVPRVMSCKHVVDDSGDRHAILLKVRNPTLGTIRLRFTGPSGSDSELAIEPHELENLLLDPFQETRAAADAVPSEATADLTPTDWLSLDPAEDAFLDIGKGWSEDPKEVDDWGASSLVEDDSKSYPSFGVIAQKGDTAWVELFVNVGGSKDGTQRENTVGCKERDYLAMSIALQIEVGNGSWESSFIKRRGLPEGEVDFVTFHLVALSQKKK